MLCGPGDKDRPTGFLNDSEEIGRRAFSNRVGLRLLWIQHGGAALFCGNCQKVGNAVC